MIKKYHFQKILIPLNKIYWRFIENNYIVAKGVGIKRLYTKLSCYLQLYIHSLYLFHI